MTPTRRRVHKYRPTPKRNRYFYNTKKEYKIVLTKIKNEEYMDEPALVKLKKRLTLLIERIIQEDCQLDKGILMNKMLKLEADLTITAYLLHANGFDYLIFEPESA